MTRLLHTALLGSLMLPLAGTLGANAADLDYSYAPPPPPVRYERPVVVAPRPVIVERRVIVERPVVYPRPYPYVRPYYVRRFAPYDRPYGRFAFGPRRHGWYGY